MIYKGIVTSMGLVVIHGGYNCGFEHDYDALGMLAIRCEQETS